MKYAYVIVYGKWYNTIMEYIYLLIKGYNENEY